MPLETLHTDAAPAAIGPFAQAVKANGMLFTAGQLPLVPATLEVVGTTVAEQTEHGDAKPARSTVAVAGLPRDVRIEIELVALPG